MDAVARPAQTYLAGGPAYLYPGAGDASPPLGVKVLLLTRYGMCLVGQWSNNDFYVGWAPLPTRNKEKEAFLKVV